MVTLEQVFAFLRNYLHQNWEHVRHAQLNHPTLSLLALMEQVVQSVTRVGQ